MASLETPTLHARVIPTNIAVDAKGGAREFVELLDEEPLRYPSAANIVPERTGGTADVHNDAVGVESFGSEGGIHDVRRAVQALGGPDHGPLETVRDHHVVADPHAEHVSPFPPHMLGNDAAERRQVSGRQPPHHLGRLIEV